MSTVYQKRDRWYVGFKDHLGRRHLLQTTATTKAEAKRLLLELERKAERQRLGLEQAPSDCHLTVKQLCEWWLKNRVKPHREYDERKRLQRYVLKTPLGDVPAAKLTAAQVEEVMRQMEKDELSPSTINGLRGALHTVFARARKTGVYAGQNPIADVESWKVPKKIHDTLKADEVPLVMPHVPAEWQGIFATALYTGLRKGEIFGLRKRDVDLDAGLLVVARSYDQATTKGGHADVIPIAKPLHPYLRAAIEKSACELVFPDSKGRMRKKEADPQKILRRAMARAGLVEGYDFVCRRCKSRGLKKHSWRYADCVERRCPTCNMRLWPRAIPRKMKFHGLRHTTATLLLRAGVPIQHVQRILRHTDIKLTVDTYGHLVVEDLRGALDALPSSSVVDAEFWPVESESATSVPTPATNFALEAGKKIAPPATQELPTSTSRKTKAGTEGNSPTSPATSMVGETGFEPATPWSRTKCSTRLSHSPIFFCLLDAPPRSVLPQGAEARPHLRDRTEPVNADSLHLLPYLAAHVIRLLSGRARGPCTPPRRE